MRKSYPLFFILACCILSSLNSCKTHEVTIPSYLYIKPVSMVITKPAQGQPAIMVNDVWIFDNGLVRGDFATGTTIPIQRSGKTTIVASAGIKYSGNGEQRTIYQMFNPYSKDIDLKPNQVDTLEPIFSYVDNAQFPLVEDFDGNGFAFEYRPDTKQNGDTILKDNGSEAWSPGKFSGKVQLKSGVANSYLEIWSKVFNNFPRAHPFYLEIDYKCNIPFVVGFYETSGSGTIHTPVYVLKEKSEWNKLYFDLASEINSKPPGTQFRFFIGFSNSNGTANPYVWLDNIKLIYLD
ncbi:MAG: hypothetical protein H7296_09525 [Bacteroidia bacterium]|nr:hypothetical protein [Bacteroidia bacterium]